jgi:CubicO group peptidase (beta-lactamase class C family)
MFAFIVLLLGACHAADMTCDHVSNFPPARAVCSAIAKWIDDDKIEQPFWISVGDGKRRLFSYRYKGFNETEPIIIFSASKWLTSATIMRLVDEGVMSLEDKTSKYIDWWTTDPSDPRSLTTLRHHLSMTDGFGWKDQGDKYPPPFPVCWAQPDITAEACTKEAYENTYGQYTKWFIDMNCTWDVPSFALTDSNVPKPGEVFFYEENHWDMMELMVEKATGKKFTDVATSKLFEPLGMEGSYQWPSYAQPDLGGGVLSTGPNYEKFLRTVINRELLSASAWDNMMKSHTANAVHGKSLLDCTGPDHVRTYGYGLGHWLHCSEKMPSACLDNHRHSSLGFGGFLPVVDTSLGYYVVISQFDPTGKSQGPALTLQERVFEALAAHPKKTEL